MPLGRFALQWTTTSGFHGNITAFMLFLHYSKFHALLTIFTSAEDWRNYRNQTLQMIPNHCWERLEIMYPTHNFETQPF
jgi:hypothetical protein